MNSSGDAHIGGASKGLLMNSNSTKSIHGTIIEGGSSSSGDNKRPSIIREKKTEEDMDDNSTEGIEMTNKYKSLFNNDNKSEEFTWSNDV